MTWVHRRSIDRYAKVAFRNRKWEVRSKQRTTTTRTTRNNFTTPQVHNYKNQSISWFCVAISQPDLPNKVFLSSCIMSRIICFCFFMLHKYNIYIYIDNRDIIVYSGFERSYLHRAMTLSRCRWMSRTMREWECTVSCSDEMAEIRRWREP